MTETVNLSQRHLVSDCAGRAGSSFGNACGAWNTTRCVWCDVEIHMFRTQYRKDTQTCSARCRVARHRAKKDGTLAD